MTKQLWINLAVRDLKKSQQFFINLGIAKATGHGNTATMAGLVFGEQKVAVMLIEEKAFKEVIRNTVTDTHLSNEAIFSFDAESCEEVDEIAKKVTANGGNVFAPPAKIQGWMYGCAFTDLDGHRWNALYMDMSKMPK